VIDPNLGDEVRVTVIATGFERASVPIRKLERAPERNERKPAAATAARPSASAEVAASTHAPKADLTEFQPRSFNPEDLDIPAFMRRR
jgi:cell division protein FtsZ